MSYKQQLGLSQKLDVKLTPQLIQRITMLQLTRMELSEMVVQELSQNPVLEELSPEETTVSADLANADYSEVPDKLLNGAADIPDNPMSSVEAFEGNTSSLSVSEQGDFDASYDQPGDQLGNLNGLGELPADYQTPAGEAAREGEGDFESRERDSFEEIDFGATFEDYLDPGYRTRETEVKDAPSFEQFLSAKEGLADYLNWQLRLTIMKPDVEAAAEVIVGNLNDDGYLDSTLEEIAAIGPWPLATVEKALSIIQQLDPTGVGARSLQECLLLQLQALGYGDRLAATMVRDHFAKLQNYKLPELARVLGVPVEQVADELKLIRQLEPKPGRKYAPPDTHYIEPEVYIEKMDDDYIIRFN
ncbi:MAG: hypothetical protein ACREEM_43635, partial [Blastocatellia bacterium]